MELKLHFLLMKTKKNVNYSPETRICSLIVEQLETALLTSKRTSRCLLKPETSSTPSLQKISIAFAKKGN